LYTIVCGVSTATSAEDVVPPSMEAASDPSGPGRGRSVFARVRFSGADGDRGSLVFSGTTDGETLVGWVHAGALGARKAVLAGTVDAELRVTARVTSEDGVLLGTVEGSFESARLTGRFDASPAGNSRILARLPESGTWEATGAGLRALAVQPE